MGEAAPDATASFLTVIDARPAPSAGSVGLTVTPSAVLGACATYSVTPVLKVGVSAAPLTTSASRCGLFHLQSPSVPTKPAGQFPHAYVPALFVHVASPHPPWSVAHSSTSAHAWVPSYPSGQLHLYEPVSLLHRPAPQGS